MTGKGKTAAKKVPARKKAGGKISITVRKAAFLAVLRDTGNVSRAAREAGLASSVAYRHRARVPQFAADWDAAIAEAMDELEEALIDRAKRGVEKPVFFRGEQIGTVKSYSDALGMFLLRTKRPDLYGRAGPEAVVEMTQADAKAEVTRRLDRLADEDAGDEAGEEP